MENNDNNPMQAALRAKCGAKTRSGGRCANYGMKNGRCRMHGGKSTGAPKGNQNAFKHGLYGKASRNHNKVIRQLLADLREVGGEAYDVR